MLTRYYCSFNILYDANSFLITLNADLGLTLRRSHSQNSLLIDESRIDGLRIDGSRIEGSRIEGLRFDGSRIDGSRIDGSRIDGSIIEGSRIDGSRVDGSRIEGSRIDGSRIDDDDPPNHRLDPNLIFDSNSLNLTQQIGVNAIKLFYTCK